MEIKLLNSVKTISSVEISELTGKPHNDLMKAIRSMEEAWINVGQGKFSQSYYQQYIAQQLFEVITRSIGSGEETFTSKTTKITGKGQVYFAKKIKETTLN